jgi:hypothetical protein
VVALCRQAAVDGAGAHGHQRLAAGAELAQHVHVLGVAQAPLDQADVAAAEGLDVGERRAVELDLLDQREQPLVDVQQRHVAAEAAGQRHRGQLQLARCMGGVMPAASSFVLPVVGNSRRS